MHREFQHPRALPVTVILLTLLVSPAGPSLAQQTIGPAFPIWRTTEDLPRQLLLRQTIEREFKSGETHSYLISLRKDEFMHAEVEQQGIDLAISLFAPDGRKLTEMNNRHTDYGQEPLSVIATAPGSYRVALSAAKLNAAKGRYAIRLVETRPSQHDDMVRIEAERSAAEGQRLRLQATAASYERALPKYELALKQWQSLGDRYWEATTLTNIGLVHDNLGEKEKALEFYNRALPLAREVKDITGEARILNNIAVFYESQGNNQKALDFYNQALTLERAAGDRDSEAGTLNGIGNVYESWGQKQKALDYYNQALPLVQAMADGGEEATTLIGIGNVYYSQGDRQKALSYYNQALTIQRNIGDRGGEAKTLNNLASVFNSFGDTQKALNYYNQALTLQQTNGDRVGTGSTLNNLGVLNDSLGEKQKALDYFNQALLIEREVIDRVGETSTLMGLGNVYNSVGEKQKALEYYNQALPIEREVGDRAGEASSLIGIGSVYESLGNKQEALAYYLQALPLERATGDRPGEASVLNNLANVYDSLGEKQQALSYYIQALAIQREVGDRALQAGTLNNLANVYNSLGERPKALDHYRQSLLLERAVGDRAGEAGTLNNLANIHKALGQTQQALAYYSQALPLERAIGDLSNEAGTLSNFMILWSELDRPSLAVFYGKQAINNYQVLRTNIQGLNKNLQKSYLQTVAASYRKLADLLIELGRLPEAEQVLAMLKEEEYFEFVSRDAAAAPITERAALTKDEALLESQYRNLADEFARLGKERGALFAKRNRSAEEDRQLAKLDEQLAVALDHFNKFLEQLQLKLGVETARGARVIDIKDTLGMKKTLRELGPGTVIVYTLLAEDKYRAMLFTPDSEHAYENPTSASEIQHKVLSFRQALEHIDVDPTPLAVELYNIIIGPKLAHDLQQAGAKTIMWSLDGVLRYLPVAALQDEQQKYLVESFNNVIFTPVSRDRLKDPVSEHWKALGLGVSRAKAGFGELPGVPQELRMIIRDPAAGQSTGDGVLDGKVLLDDSFTKDAMKAALRQNFQLIHIASHFRFRPGNDETGSFLLLGEKDEQNDKLTVAEIRKLSFEGVDLMTLSACDTAMGDTNEDGIEVESFGVLAQRQGAEAVMATLWPVADLSTPLLMHEFYRQRETHPGMSKTEALRQAQLALINGSSEQSKASSNLAQRSEPVDGPNQKRLALPAYRRDQNKPFAHPYFWAPFILIGNWK